jgi:4-diphosphocytidyl-2-C-methyl-D-erythritol kinase
MTAVEEFAPAKVNLALHVTGQRDDGYHLIDTVVQFARDLGDRIIVEPAGEITLDVQGPAASGIPSGEDNLVLKAARQMRALSGVDEGAAITLEKHLPHGAGLGGGSADAAACARALARLWNVAIPAPQDLCDLGADIPMCMVSDALRARGIGESITKIDVPIGPAVIVQPGIVLNTGAVFSALNRRRNPPLPDVIPEFPDAVQFHGWLAEQRNDLQSAAVSLVPEIETVLSRLQSQPGCENSRMSGSGSACFGLFSSVEAADQAVAALCAANPSWWVRRAELG